MVVNQLNTNASQGQLLIMDDQANKRIAKRTKVAVPVVLEEGVGVSQNISQSGIYLKTSQPFTPGDRVKFTLELEYAAPDGPVHFQCTGRIVRVEKIGNEYGVASTIEEMNTLH